jgi:pimeloyl-ACP methyl ester carboxylesterase
VIPDAGHSPQFENPEAWHGALIEFLDRIDAAETVA